MKNYKKVIVIISIITLAYSYVSYEFYVDYTEYLSLKKSGEIIESSVTFDTRLGSWWYFLEFVPDIGDTIRQEGKCGSYENCREFYDNLKIIYLPDNPNIFLELPFFLNYSVMYKIFFYFILSGLMYSLFPIFILKIITKIYKYEIS